MTDKCPTCGEESIPILYGMPSPAAFEAAERGGIAFGGCVLPEVLFEYRCAAGHSWGDSAGQSR